MLRTALGDSARSGVCSLACVLLVCTLVRVERVVLLQSLATVPLPFWPLPDTELLPFVPCECLSFFVACILPWTYGL